MCYDFVLACSQWLLNALSRQSSFMGLAGQLQSRRQSSHHQSLEMFHDLKCQPLSLFILFHVGTAASSLAHFQH